MKAQIVSKFAKKVPRKGTGLYYDPLYGYVPLPDYLREAMDLDVFQSLQGIKQLSTVYLTFRGAVHTRFDHCVGTAYLASILYNKLRELAVESDGDTPQINPILEASIRLAALFHDVGHGPFGHIFEMFCKRNGKFKGWTHEKMARKLITGQDEDGNDIEYENEEDEKNYKQIKTVLENIIQSESHEDYITMARDLMKGKDADEILAALLKYSFADELDPGNYNEIRDEQPKIPGQTRLFIAKGRKNGMTPKKLTKFITENIQIKPQKIKDITIQDHFSFITVPFREAEIILLDFKKQKRGKRPLVEKAKTK